MYSTFRDRVLEILHSLEILVDTQARTALKGDVKTLQTLDRRKFVTGYDVLDLLDPLSPVTSRIAHFDTWGDGWMDLLPSITATILFGEGYGDLVRPRDSTSVCAHWKTVPTLRDYMCASISTLKMLHEKRLRRHGSTSSVGEFSSKLLWTSTCQPFQKCRCLVGHLLEQHEHVDPRQFLVSAKMGWKSKLIPKGSTPIDINALRETGAVVFANSGILNRQISETTDATRGDEKDSQTLSSLTSRTSVSMSTSASVIASSQGTANASSTTYYATALDTNSSAAESAQDPSGVKKKGKSKRKGVMGIFGRS